MDGTDSTAGADVRAGGLGLKGPRGWAFRGVTVDAEPGSLVAIEGPSGSGRTCLLLALTGRMKPTEGMAAVGGFELPRHMAALRCVSALANVAGVTDPEPALTVGEHLRERSLLQRRFGDSLRELLHPRARRAHEARLRVDAALAAAGLDLDNLPKGSRTAVRDLERPDELRLSVALALIGRPRLLGVDDVDMKLSDAERAEVWDLLRSLTRAGTTVLAVCRTAPGDCVSVSTLRGDGAGEETTGIGTDDGTGSGAGDDESGAGDDDGGDPQDGPEDAKEESDALTEARRA
ncbi:ATP-binding cassette domain-containing protein [Streptomyces dangxiongensis]|uniref:ATP-binding cassette domain-containing protein n=1 Tax=Streptomyces dangxiongensis TaxID=1442032 RepID=A0A3G2JJK2_9ACTN|nr:ATP-binding cassette domain-containing protein [Streptomyces dangxiongensis]AYN41791.1 ATP-binding cassette domain-containing protein [Streptomyces dangxiongensis]